MGGDIGERLWRARQKSCRRGIGTKPFACSPLRSPDGLARRYLINYKFAISSPCLASAALTIPNRPVHRSIMPLRENNGLLGARRLSLFYV